MACLLSGSGCTIVFGQADELESRSCLRRFFCPLNRDDNSRWNTDAVVSLNQRPSNTQTYTIFTQRSGIKRPVYSLTELKESEVVPPTEVHLAPPSSPAGSGRRRTRRSSEELDV